MTVVGLQPNKAMMDVSGRKSYIATDDNPFGNNSSGVKELTDPNLWDEEW